MTFRPGKELYDVIVVGGGPAGLTAALYIARARYRVLVLEKENYGGQLTITERVVNYPGLRSISGAELTDNMRQQAEAFGAEFRTAEVTGLDMTGTIKTVRTTTGDLSCYGVLLATGARPRLAGFTGEEEFRGRGVAYCATCDGEFFRDLPVFVIGGGYAAAEESLFLTKYASHVTVLVRGDDFKCDRETAEKVRANENITVLTNTVAESVEGDSVIHAITYLDKKTGERQTYRAKDGEHLGVFVFAGYVPETGLAEGIADLTHEGYLVTDASMKTSCDGLYAAGDNRVKSLRQAITAAGDGALAATELERYAQRMQQQAGICPLIPAHIAEAEEKALAPKAGDAGASGGGSFIPPEMAGQLQTVFGRMEQPLELRLLLDGSDKSRDLEAFMTELASETEMLSVTREEDDAETERPRVRVFRADGSYAGISFHGVPGGHEFTSFVLGLYNAAGKGQAIDEVLRDKILSFKKERHLKIYVGLSCTMCPDLVTAAQRIATLNPHVRTDVYDLSLYPEIQKKHNIMSVPCFFIGDEGPHFGKKNIAELAELIG